MKKRRIIILCVLLVTIVLVLIINNINIFKVTTKSPEEIYNIVSSKYNLDEVDVSVIKYHSVTGASWFVEKSTEKELENKNVCLSSVLNPRQLKVNKDFELDYFAQYVIVTKKTDKYMEIAKETVEILYPVEYIITGYYHENDGDDYFKVKDLSLKGKLNLFVSMFVSKYRMQY